MMRDTNFTSTRTGGVMSRLRMLALVLLTAVLGLLVVAPTVQASAATMPSAGAMPRDGEKDLSLYKLGSGMAAYLSNAMSPNPNAMGEGTTAQAQDQTKQVQESAGVTAGATQKVCEPDLIHNPNDSNYKPCVNDSATAGPLAPAASATPSATASASAVSGAAAPAVTKDAASVANFLGVHWGGFVRSGADAGGFLGYVDDDLTKWTKWFTSSVSSSSVTYGYSGISGNAVMVAGETNSANSPNDGMYTYAAYGALLSNLGYDSTSTAQAFNLDRMIMGSLMIFAFWLASAVPMLFGFAIDALSALNPFKLIWAGVSKGLSGTALAQQMTGDSGDPASGGFLAQAANVLGNLYADLQAWGWAVTIPAFLGVFFFSLVMYNSQKSGPMFKKLLIRMVFIAVGVPLIGATYTAALDSARSTGISGTNTIASRIVLSNYLDFESWIKDGGRLSVPACATMEWDKEKNQPTNATKNQIRANALAINAQSGYKVPSTLGLESMSTTGACAPTETNATQDGNTLFRVNDMLQRYKNGTQINAADFETDIKNDISKTNGEATNHGMVASPYSNWAMGWFNDYVEPANAYKAEPDNNPVISVKNGTGLGRANVPDTDGKTITFYTAGKCDGYARVSDAGGRPVSCNLSVLSMYNYLNTSFGDRSLTVFSSEKATSTLNREIHNSVTQVGTGVMALMFWASSVSMLMCIAMLGLFYAFGMFVSIMARGFQALANVVPSMFGSLQAITKFMVIVATMIAELFATIFLYRVVSEMILSFSTVFEAPLASRLNGVGESQTTVSGGGVAVDLGAANGTSTTFDPNAVSGSTNLFTSSGLLLPLAMMLSAVILVMVTVKMIKLRGSMMKAVDMALTKVMEQLMSTQTTPPVRPGGVGGMGNLARAGAGAATTGAGMALGERLMGGRGGASSTGEVRPGSKGAGSSGDGAPGGKDSPKGKEGGLKNALTGGASARELMTGSDDRGADPTRSGDPDAPMLPGGDGEGGAFLDTRGLHADEDSASFDKDDDRDVAAAALQRGHLLGGKGEVVEGEVVKDAEGNDVSADVAAGATGAGAGAMLASKDDTRRQGKEELTPEQKKEVRKAQGKALAKAGAEIGVTAVATATAGPVGAAAAGAAFGAHDAKSRGKSPLAGAVKGGAISGATAGLSSVAAGVKGGKAAVDAAEAVSDTAKVAKATKTAKATSQVSRAGASAVRVPSKTKVVTSTAKVAHAGHQAGKEQARTQRVTPVTSSQVRPTSQPTAPKAAPQRPQIVRQAPAAPAPIQRQAPVSKPAPVRNTTMPVQPAARTQRPVQSQPAARAQRPVQSQPTRSGRPAAMNEAGPRRRGDLPRRGKD